MIPKKRTGGVFAASVLFLLGVAAAHSAEETHCDPTLGRIFSPQHALLGRYEVCTDPGALPALTPAGASIDFIDAVDAFGRLGAFDRAALVRLYAGTRPQIARTWTQSGGRFEALTFISPYPDATLTRFEPGTLLIRWICDAACVSRHLLRP